MNQPKLAPDTLHNAPVKTVGDNSTLAEGGHASIQDRAGLYIAIVALILAVLSIGLVIMMPIVIEAKVQAGIERARADMQQQVAQAQQTANAGREHARIALDDVQRANAELAAKGLITKRTEH